MDFQFSVGIAVALVFVGEVNPVIEVPDEARGLVLHVAAAFSTFVDFDFLVSHAVAVGVAVGPEVEGVRDADHDAVVEREDHAGKEDVVDEDGVFVVDAIVIGVFMAGDSRLGSLFSGGVGVLHVGSHFDDVEGAIAIPGHCNGLVDVGIAQNEIERVAVLKFDGFVGLIFGEETFLVNGITWLGEQGGGEY